MKTLRDLLIHELKDLYSAEQQLTKALPKMADAAENHELKTAFRNHLEQTKEHARRLEQAFELLDQSARAEKCEAMEGLIAEGREMIDADNDAAVLDAGLIAAAQRVEHYEMAGYGCARTFAKDLGEHQVASLLQQTLDEESAANDLLTEIATSEVNDRALHAAEV